MGSLILSLKAILNDILSKISRLWRQLTLRVTLWITQIYLLFFTNVIQWTCLRWKHFTILIYFPTMQLLIRTVQKLSLIMTQEFNWIPYTMTANAIIGCSVINMALLHPVAGGRAFLPLITHWEKLLDSDWLRDCEFIRNLRTNSAIRGKLQISRAKSVIRSEWKYKKEITINN